MSQISFLIIILNISDINWNTFINLNFSFLILLSVVKLYSFDGGQITLSR